MKYLPLIWAGLWRKPIRTVLTLLSVVVAFTLFGLAHGVMAGLDAIINQMSDTRLRIQSRVNITEPLPYAYLSRIESVPGVEGVFLGSDFISVTKDGAEWSHIKPAILGVIMEHFLSGKPVLNDGTSAEVAGDEFFEPEDSETVEVIKELLETRIRPAVAMDGGDITLKGYRDGMVYLHMQGACSGCPSSTATLKNGIENLLRHFVPGVEGVAAMSGRHRDQHRGLADLEPADAVQHRHALDARPAAANGGADLAQLGLRHAGVGLVLEELDRAAARLVAHHAGEDHDAAGAVRRVRNGRHSGRADVRGVRSLRIARISAWFRGADGGQSGRQRALSELEFLIVPVPVPLPVPVLATKDSPHSADKEREEPARELLRSLSGMGTGTGTGTTDTPRRSEQDRRLCLSPCLEPRRFSLCITRPRG